MMKRAAGSRPLRILAAHKGHHPDLPTGLNLHTMKIDWNDFFTVLLALAAFAVLDALFLGDIINQITG